MKLPIFGHLLNKSYDYKSEKDKKINDSIKNT